LNLRDVVKVLLELAEMEGEDVTLKALCSALNVDVPLELRGLEDLPPRVAFAIAYTDRELRPLLKEVASELLREGLAEGPIEGLPNKRKEEK